MKRIISLVVTMPDPSTGLWRAECPPSLYGTAMTGEGMTISESIRRLCEGMDREEAKFRKAVEPKIEDGKSFSFKTIAHPENINQFSAKD